MVNVAGRSKGCSTCRRRRVKCDEQRPVCGRCLKCGFECGGAKETTFVEGYIVKSRRTDRRTAASVARNVADTDPAGRQLSLSASLKGNPIEIYICYTRKHLHPTGVVNLALEGLQLSDIMALGTISAETMTANSQIFPQAFLSFAMIYFGDQHQQAHITNQGYAMHGVALKRINQALSDSNFYMRDELILSIVTLALLECFVPTGTNHYLQHMLGLEKLLELRGPSKSRISTSFELYKGVRRMILFASLRAGRPSILAREEWKNAFKMNCSDQEMQEQDLFDVLADCTVLIADSDELSANWGLDLERDEHHRGDMERKALILLTHLRTWKTRWEIDKKNSYIETLAAGSVLEPEESPWNASSPLSTFFEFSNSTDVSALVFYNTVLIYVLRVLASLAALEWPGIDQSFLQNTLQNEYLDDLWRDTCTKEEYNAAEYSAALEVCRCLPSFLTEKSLSSSGCLQMVHLAVVTVWVTLRGNESAETKWMTNLLSTGSRGIIAKGILQT